MSTVPRFLRRDPAEIAPRAETCGQIWMLIEGKDEAAGEVCEVEIADAKLHEEVEPRKGDGEVEGADYPRAARRDE